MGGTIRMTLEQVLAQKSVTRYWLARRIGIDYATVDHYYKNKTTRFDSNILAKFCSALDCDVSDLLEYVEKEE